MLNMEELEKILKMYLANAAPNYAERDMAKGPYKAKESRYSCSNCGMSYASGGDKKMYAPIGPYRAGNTAMYRKAAYSGTPAGGR